MTEWVTDSGSIPRMPRPRSSHFGVKLVLRTNGTNVARWTDPITGKVQQELLEGNERARKRWATNKAKELAETQAAVADGLAAPERITLADAVKKHLATFENKGTRATRRIALDSFTAWCSKHGVHDAQEVKPITLAHWREHHYLPSTSKLATSSRNRWTISVAVFFNWARSQGYVPRVTRDNLRDCLKRKEVPKDALDFLRPPEIEKLLQAALRFDAANPWHGANASAAPFLLLTLLSGMRSAEVRLLRWAEVDLGAREIRLPAARVKTKRARAVDLRISPVAVDLLRALKLRTPGELVFPEWTQGRLENTVRRLQKEYGAPPFSMHVLRRTCGTLTTCAPGIFGGASAYLTAKRLGHSVEISERSYLGVLRDLGPAAKTIEAAAGIEDIAQKIIERAGGKAEAAKAAMAE